MKPMLAKTAERSDLIRYAEDPNWWFSQKVDGVRLLAEINGGNRVRLFNREGDSAKGAVNNAVMTALRRLSKDGHQMTLDGEYLSGRFYIFDMPTSPTFEDEMPPFEQRYDTLKTLMKLWKPAPAVQLLPFTKTTDAKLRMAKRLLERNAEGLIVRRKMSAYVPGGRSASMLKIKYVKSLDCVVTEVGRYGKQNLGLGVYRNGQMFDVGEVSALTGDGAKCRVGHVVEITYLYATGSGRLYQPVTPRLRTDKKPTECTFDQLQLSDKGIIKKW